ncbi:hypothetical protein ZWY2020_015005 [Hordeum vulgare]|nr:hypothetical protein ZWY2020_015005 [Hordeum vulgare]
MGSEQKPHVVFVPFPAHGHVAPHTQLARVLHARGFHVTLVHTELHHRRLVLAEAAASPAWLGVEELLRAMACRPGVPPVSCVVADAPMSFASIAARDVGVPDVVFFTASAAGLMGYLQFQELVKRGLVPLKGAGYKTDGSLDAPVDWVPGMKGMRLRDMPTFCHTTDADSALLSIHLLQMRVVAASKAVVINTFHGMEKDVVDALAAFLPPVYTVGPLSRVVSSLPAGSDDFSTSTDTPSLFQEDPECMAAGRERGSPVVYVSYGSHAPRAPTR